GAAGSIRGDSAILLADVAQAGGNVSALDCAYRQGVQRLEVLREIPGCLDVAAWLERGLLGLKIAADERHKHRGTFRRFDLRRSSVVRRIGAAVDQYAQLSRPRPRFIE